MNGIAGIIYPDVFQVNQTINRMLKCLRTPSDKVHGPFTYHNMEVGTGTSQIFSNEKQSIYAGLCGYLNNPDELRKELEREGFTFTTKTDEELLVRAYELWGSYCLAKLDGGFALFILDTKQEKIILARDPIGKKSLYWYQDQNHFLFSNQLKALLITGFVPQTPAPDALASYLYLGYCPQDMTPIKGVNKLLPGHYLEIGADKSMKIESYWSFSTHFINRSTKSIKSISTTLDQLISEAVSSHVPPEGPVGCFLSGGLGSATVAYYLAKSTSHDRIKSFSVGYQGQNEDDVLAAADVADELHISQTRKLISSQDALEDFPQIVWYLDEPIADITVTSTWQLSQLASGQVNTVMSGMGSDELFAAHTRYSMDIQKRGLLGYLTQYGLNPLSYVLAPVIGKLYKPAAYALLKHARTNTWQYNYLQQNALFDIDLLEKAAPRLKGFDPEIFLNKFYNLPRIKSNTSALQYIDIKTRLADQYVMQLQKLTEANNLNWYSPFLNKTIMEYAASLPVPDQLSENEIGHYLKAIFNNLLPDSVLKRPKKVRSNFLGGWFDDASIIPLFQMLLKGTLVESGLISREWLKQQLSNPQKTREMFRYLWAILSLEVWFRMFVTRPVDSVPPEVTLSELLSEEP